MKKIAFINTHYHPINENLLRIFKENFPDYEIDFIDLVKIIKKNYLIQLLNLLFILIEFNKGLFKGTWKIKEAFFRTTFIHKRMKKKINAILKSGDYEFSFQTNSLFDTSLKGLPHFIYTDHTNMANLGYPHFKKEKLVPEKIIELEKKIYQNALRSFTYSTNVANSISNHYGIDSSKVKCVYAGSNVPVDGLSKKNDDSNEKYINKNILFVGIDWVRKGGPDLISSFEKILEIHPDASVTIIGAEPSIDIKNVKVIGRIPVDKLPEYYAKASIFCLPTKLEPFGIVFVEAMMYKLPIVSTRIGALPDFVTVGENGYLIDPGNIEQLTNALLDLLNDSEKCERFGQRGYEIASEKYTWNKVGERLKENIISALKSEREA